MTSASSFIGVVLLGAGLAATLASLLGAGAPSDAVRSTQDRPGRERLVVRRSHGRSPTALELVRYGRAGALGPLTTVGTSRNGPRVEYRRRGDAGHLLEWYQNTPRGIEQGFTLEKAPPGSGDLLLEMSAGGLTPRLTSDARRIDLLDGDGGVQLHYSELSAKDALDRPLNARLQVDDAHVIVRIDDRGATYPLLIDPLIWAQQGAALTVADGLENAHLGVSVAVSGDTLAVAATNGVIGRAGGQGAAYVFVRSGNGFVKQEPTLVGTDGQSIDFGNDGYTLALSDDTLLVGQYNGSTKAGAAYAFVRSGTEWFQQGSKLLPASVAGDDEFGTAVSVSGDTAVVGAPNTAVGAHTSQGAVYVFTRAPTMFPVNAFVPLWTQQGASLVANDGATNDGFGSVVALSGDTIVVGSEHRSAVYVFVRSGSTWTQQAELVAPGGLQAGLFGRSVAISGDTVIVGDTAAQVDATVSGAAFVFVRNGTIWSQQGLPLAASDQVSGDIFGTAVALSGDTAVVGAWGKGVDNKVQQGAAYVFVRSGAKWRQQGPALTSNDGADGDHFGGAVAVSGQIAVVGADNKRVETRVSQGAAYAFFLAGTSGDSCADSADCQSGFCSDGVCCDEACSDACDACSVRAGSTQDGACSILPAGSRGSPACDEQACNGTVSSCTACTSDEQCLFGHYCAADGTCALQLADGLKCDERAGKLCLDGDCALCSSGNCVDGICCDTSCDGTCEACAAAITGGADGTCIPVPADADPEDECARDGAYPVSCGADGTCDGNGACRAFAPADTACGVDVCENDARCPVCNGAGDCVAVSSCSDDLTASIPADGKPLSCEPYLCDRSSSFCRDHCTTVDDCGAGYFCDSAGACLRNSSNAAAGGEGCACRAACGQSGGAAAGISVGFLLVALTAQRRRRADRRCGGCARSSRATSA